ncbi:hypothetical protein K3152_09840 [Qipengyuania sp. 1NDH17]|uniref:Secreted protein n=1 Tax=Qipengyuania polymorpha TaxID=2867234 RepID=A0ABS7J236_9SPHN|nr:hypothetical protein [Qipengyuania polymorpha]MBX7458546.1 hypothetical protein [Qipengyuania polymorpha]
MFRKSALAVGAWVLGVAAPAQATPPDHVVIIDTPFGVSGETLFVLRHTSDNLGLHTAQRSETWLVAIDAASGEETFWPVHAVERHSEWVEETGGEVWKVTSDVPEEAVNPYAILAEHGGATLAGSPGRFDSEAPAASVSDGIISVEYQPDRRFVLRAEEAQARHDAAVAALANKVANVGRMAPVTTRDVFLGTLAGEATCTFTSLGWPLWLTPGEKAYQPIRVSCPAWDGAEGHSLIQLLP